MTGRRAAWWLAAAWLAAAPVAWTASSASEKPDVPVAVEDAPPRDSKLVKTDEMETRYVAPLPSNQSFTLSTSWLREALNKAERLGPWTERIPSLHFSLERATGAEITPDSVRFQGVEWQMLPGRDEIWLGYEQDEDGRERATISLQYCF